MSQIDDLLSQLESAVRAGDRVRADELVRQIQRALVSEFHDQAAIERRMRELLGRLSAPTCHPENVQLDVPTCAEPVAEIGAGGAGKLLRVDFATERELDDTASVAGTVYPVWFGTNRKPDGRGGFGTERNDRTTRGRADVLIPEGHRFGESGSPFWEKLLRFDLRDDTLRLQALTTQERDAWFGEIQQAMYDAKASGVGSHALFFLHGFNVTFEEAAIRAAQVGFDLKVPGATAFFSWPSRGNVAAYPADEATIEASERAITEFLVDFATHCGAEKVHVIAHSMGNRGLLRALQRIATNAETQGTVKFGQIFLAAPDVDRDLFLDLARLYPEHSERTTLYASDGDLPVHISAKLHDAPRAGYFKPYTVTVGVDTVAVPDFDVDLLGHSYFAQAEALLHDMYDLMRHDTAPAQRQRLAEASDGAMKFWQLRR